MKMRLTLLDCVTLSHSDPQLNSFGKFDVISADRGAVRRSGVHDPAPNRLRRFQGVRTGNSVELPSECVQSGQRRAREGFGRNEKHGSKHSDE